MQPTTFSMESNLRDIEVSHIILDKSDHIIFREITEKSELTAGLKLRYNEYLNSRLRYWVEKNMNGVLDIDDWDPYARHFGLYAENISDKPIGYMRVIQDSLTNVCNIVYDLSKDIGLNLNPPKYKFSVLSYFPGVQERLIETAKNFNKEMIICEPGRFTIKKEFRNYKNAKFLSECAIATYSTHFTHSIMSCAESHFKFYNKIGF
ncbi:MAG: hypothetical protein ABI844_12540 [Saprospiraceae bacterium]